MVDLGSGQPQGRIWRSGGTWVVDLGSSWPPSQWVDLEVGEGLGSGFGI